MRLAQSRFDRVLAGIDLAAGKGDLPRVRAHVRGAVEQQDARLPLPLGHRREHGGGRELGDAFKPLVAKQSIA